LEKRSLPDSAAGPERWLPYGLVRRTLHGTLFRAPSLALSFLLAQAAFQGGRVFFTINARAFQASPFLGAGALVEALRGPFRRYRRTSGISDAKVPPGFDSLGDQQVPRTIRPLRATVRGWNSRGRPLRPTFVAVRSPPSALFTCFGCWRPASVDLSPDLFRVKRTDP